MRKAIVLLSGGLDSATTLGLALEAGEHVIPLAFDYKQRHRKEVSCAFDIVHHYQKRRAPIDPLRVVSIGGLDLPSSALTSEKLPVPTGRDEVRMAEDIPVTYVPARNSVFLSVATGFAEALEADSVWAGYNAVDYSGYPDCRPEYVHAMQVALALGTKRGVSGNPIRLVAPIIEWSKDRIAYTALELNVPVELTWSCYMGLDKPCGQCDSCKIRIAAFKKIGAIDPAMRTK